jgi:hypothetical protein
MNLKPLTLLEPKGASLGGEQDNFVVITGCTRRLALSREIQAASATNTQVSDEKICTIMKMSESLSCEEAIILRLGK